MKFQKHVVEECDVLIADKEMSSGQIAMVFSDYEDLSPYFDDKGIKYHLDVVIADTMEECVEWYMDMHYTEEGEETTKITDVSTGRCGLEGLMFALACVKSIISTMKEKDILEVTPSDDKRESAYRRLLKHGFVKEGCSYVYTK